jgi:hypothetical protein
MGVGAVGDDVRAGQQARKGFEERGLSHKRKRVLVARQAGSDQNFGRHGAPMESDDKVSSSDLAQGR